MGNAVAVDSNALTYLLDAVEDAYEPNADRAAIAPERLAMIRLLFYSDFSFWVSPTVRAEYLRITDSSRRQTHDRWAKYLLLDVEPLAPSFVLDNRASELRSCHNDADDCRIVAEVEAIGISTLLSSDKDLIGNLGGKTSVTILRPSELLASLAIQVGAQPRVVPAQPNPLAGETWWRM